MLAQLKNQGKCQAGLKQKGTDWVQRGKVLSLEPREVQTQAPQRLTVQWAAFSTALLAARERWSFSSTYCQALFWAAQYKTGRFYSWLPELKAIKNRKRAGELTQLFFLGTSYCGEQGEEGQITSQHIRLCSLYSCTYTHTRWSEKCGCLARQIWD